MSRDELRRNQMTHKNRYTTIKEKESERERERKRDVIKLK
jgi:hypothetical protein